MYTLNDPKPLTRTRLTEVEKRDILALWNLQLLDTAAFACERGVNIYAIHRFVEQIEKQRKNKKKRKRLTADEKIGLLQLFDLGNLCVRTLAQSWGVSTTSLYKTLKQNNRKKEKKTKKSKIPVDGHVKVERREALLEEVQEEKLSVPELAKKYGVSRQSIYTLLQRRKILTTKKEKVSLLCPTCQTQFLVSPSLSKKKFCSRTCSDTWQIALPKLNSQKHCYGQRIARAKLEQYIQLNEEWIVWHADRNWLNNDIGNLLLFDTFQNLLYYLLWGAVEPIFNGKDVE